MKNRAFSLTLIFLISVSAYAVGMSAAAVGPPSLPVAPIVGANPGNRPWPDVVGPTQNITSVANAISLRPLSLTTEVFLPSGLALTKVVCIYVTLESYTGVHSDSGIQEYNATTGNRFVSNDKEGNGKPRTVRLKVYLHEHDKSGCGREFGTGFNMPDTLVNLDPLYDVSIGPIAFTPQNNCPLWANNQIRVRWFSPDDQPHEARFRLVGASTQYAQGSQWGASAVSASANYHVPSFGFYNSIPREPSAPSNVNIIPAPLNPSSGTPLPSQQVSMPVSDITNSCRALAGYIINRQLKQYPSPLIETVPPPLRAK